MFKITTIALTMLFSLVMTFVAIPSALCVEGYNAPGAAVEEEVVPSTDGGDIYYEDSQDERETIEEGEALEQEGEQSNEQLLHEEQEVTE